MKKLVIFVLLSLGSVAFGATAIEVKILSHTNLRNNVALETCGTAIHASGLKPLLVNVKHDESSYSTLTDEAGNWCVVIKRWNNSGSIVVSASTLDFKDRTVSE